MEALIKTPDKSTKIQLTKQVIYDSWSEALAEGGWAGWQVTQGRKYITAEYCTRVRGDRCHTYRLTFDEFNDLPGRDIRDKLFYLQDHSGIKPFKHSKKIQ